MGFDPENRYNFRRRFRQKLMVQMDRAVSIVSEKFPYQDEDVAKVLEALCVDPKFLAVLSGWWMPRLSKWGGPLATYLVSMRLRRAVRGVASVAEFQNFVRAFVERLVASSMESFEVRGLEQLDPEQGYLFVSNHRDIAGDSMLLNLALHRHGLGTVRIAVGDNLIEEAYATDLMRLNKSFFINRTGTNPREVYKDLTTASKYILDSIAERQSVWIAQSEGRAKNGRDLTDVSVLKMLQLSDRKAPVAQHFQRLRIVPTTLSYEFDPLDAAKAREVRLVRETGRYDKSPGEDLRNLALGLTGAKGRVVLTVGCPLARLPDTVEELAEQIDAAVLAGQTLFPINEWAAARIDAIDQSVGDLPVLPSTADEAFGRPSTAEGLARFEACSDEDRMDLLSMYAAPVQLKAALR